MLTSVAHYTIMVSTSTNRGTNNMNNIEINTSTSWLIMIFAIFLFMVSAGLGFNHINGLEAYRMLGSSLGTLVLVYMSHGWGK